MSIIVSSFCIIVSSLIVSLMSHQYPPWAQRNCIDEHQREFLEAPVICKSNDGMCRWMGCNCVGGAPPQN